MSDQYDKDDKIPIGGLWEGEDGNGNQYFKGTLFYGTNILIFKNTYKEEGSRDPDFKMYLARKPKKRDDDEDDDRRDRRRSRKRKPGRDDPPPIGDDDSDIPF